MRYRDLNPATMMPDSWRAGPDEPLDHDHEPEQWGVWITLHKPNYRGTITVRCHDLTRPMGDPLVFDTEHDAELYATKRVAWYARRGQWCQVAVGRLEGDDHAA